MQKHLETDIYSYLDYREFLKEAIQEKRRTFKHFSYSYFARAANLGSHSYLRMVMKGQRNLSTKTIYKFAKALNLKSKELTYFETLVNFNQSSTEVEKDQFYSRLKRLRPKSFGKNLDPDQLEYFSKRYYVTIREMVALKGFKEDYDWMGMALRPKMRGKDVEAAVELLLRLKLLVRDENENLLHSRETLSFPKEIPAVEIYNYNHMLLAEAKHGVLTSPRDLVEMLAISIPASKKLLPQIREIMNNCQNQILELINESEEGYDEVFQFLLQFYPLTEVTYEQKKK